MTRIFASSCALLLFLAHVGGAQDEPLIRTESRFVLLDVVVTGKDGRPIRGLTQSDFTVSENGAPQRIVFFKASDEAAGKSQVNTARNLILLDELNIAFPDLAYARDRIVEFVERNPAEQHPTSLMVVGPKGLTMVQDYTSDNGLLKSKLIHLAGYNANPKGGVDMELAKDHATAALASLTEIARSAAWSPFSVNVIWVTSGFAGLLQRGKSSDQLDAGLRGVANLLIRSRMRLYTIDPAGVVPITGLADAGKLTRGSTQDSHQSAAEAVLNSTGGEAMTADILLRHMTKIMGGLSYRGRNDVEVALQQAVEDGSSAYSIGYSPSNAEFDGGYRKIEVRTNVQGSSARTRQGYYADAGDFKPGRKSADQRLEDALFNPASYGALSLACPMKFDEGSRQMVGKIIVKQSQSSAAADQTQQVIRVGSFDSGRKLLNSWIWRVNWKDPWTNRTVDANFDKVIAPKARDVRFIVSDAAGERIGSCEYPLP